MKQNKKNNSVAAGLFTTKQDEDIILDKMIKKNKEIKKVGRPRANDIKKEDKLVRVAYYLKPEQRKKVRIKSSENDSDSSSIIRELIDKHL